MSISEFNNIYVQFLNQLRSNYTCAADKYPEEVSLPSVPEKEVKNDTEVDDKDNSSTDEDDQVHELPSDEELKYLLHFMEHIFPNMKQVARCNEEWFNDEGEEMEVVSGVKFASLMQDEKMTEKGMNRVWEYLHTLYIRAQATKLTVRLLKERFADHHLYKPIKKAILRYSDYLTFIVEFLNSQREEESETDSDDDEDVNDVEGDDEGSAAAAAEGEEGGATATPEKEGAAPAAEGENASESANTGGLGGLFDGTMFNDTLIGNLAKEIHEEIDTSALENLNTDGDMFSTLFNSDNSSSMMNMMQSVCKKLDEKAKSGELNPQQMLSELGGSMMGPMMDQVKNMMGGVAPNRKQRRRAKRKAKRAAKKSSK